MHTHVNRHLVRHGETFSTHRALERPLPRVGEPVGAHCSHLGESFTAVGTNVRLLSSVNPGVAPQASCGGEALGAVGALVRSLPCVCAHVLFQVVAVSEAATTHQTALWAVVVVAQLVVVEAFLRQETLPTLLTLIRFLVVNSLVILELADSRERLVTVSAPEAMVWAVGELVVTHLMVPQQVSHLERLPAMRTLIFSEQLDALVSDSLVQGPELAATFGADMGSVFTLPLPVTGQVSFCSEGFPTLRAFVGLHRRVKPLMLQKFKAVLEAPPTQRTVVRDPSSGVDGFEGFSGGQR